MASFDKQIHQDKALEQISIQYRNGNLIADLLSPAVMVQHETDKFYVYDQGNLTLPQTLRANKGKANEAQYNVSTSSYQLKKHSLKDLVSDDDRANADEALDVDVDTTEQLTDRILLRKEYDLAQLVQDTGTFSNQQSLSATAIWSLNTTLSDPIPTFNTATSVINKNAGLNPNTIVMSNNGFISLKDHVSLIDRTKYTSPDSFTEAMMAKLFGVDRVLVSKGIYDTDQESVGGSISMAYIWTNTCFLGYIERSPGLKKPSALYSFNQIANGSNFIVKKWREEERDGDFVEVTTRYQHKAIATNAGYLIVGH